jgi:hypothetical protein
MTMKRCMVWVACAFLLFGCGDDESGPGGTTSGTTTGSGGTGSGTVTTGGTGGIGGGSTQTSIIPADRRILWEGNVGIPGGIPNRTDICATIDASTYGDGSTDAAPAIQAALDSCPDDQVVLVPAGTYRIDSTVYVRSHRVLRGAGMDQTIISFQGPADGRHAIAMWGHPGLTGGDPAVAITAGADKGSQTITVASTAGAQVGEIMLVDQLNDGDLVDSEGVQAKCTHCGREDGDRTLGQLVEVTAIAGIDITFPPPLYVTYAGNSPEASFALPDQFIRWAGVEDLTLTQPNVSARYLIELQAAQFCWLKNVEVERVDWRAVWVQQSLQSEISGCYFHESINGYGRSHGYGVLLTSFSSANLIENNILRTLDGGFIQTSGASGNVIAYNYTIDSRFDDDWWLTGSPTINHAPHPIMNLWEGNVGYQVSGDFIWGSSSHNTVYRSRSLGWQSETITANNNAVAFGKKNTYMNVVGCVLGTEGRSTRYEVLPGQPYDVSSEISIWALGVMHPDADDPNVAATLLRHGNYDYVNTDTIWDPEIEEQTLPPSLYLSAKPAWFGDVPWPPIGPDVPTLTEKIPAQLRFEALTNP